MKLVIIESPYAGNVELNLRYLRACMHDSLVNHGEAPYASHGLYTQPGVLHDDVAEERATGIHAGFAWRDVAELTVVYTDLGITKGMTYGIEHAQKSGIRVEYRTLGEEWTPRDCFGNPTIEPLKLSDDEADRIVVFATDRWGK